MSSYRFEIFADYHQFWLKDKSVLDEFFDVWNSKSLNDSVYFGQNYLAVSTSCEMNVSVDILIVDKKPNVILEAYRHIVLGGIDLNSGKFVVHGVSDFVPDCECIRVKPGYYSVLIGYDDDRSVEQKKYYVYLWPVQELIELRIIKNGNDP